MYSMQDLCELFNLSRHTIRKYIWLGVIPHAVGMGPHAHYTDEHVRLLRRIRNEVHDRTQLADLAERRLYESGQARA